ncbi:hypothetical protein DFA_07951 [Cavenderia fasciculata]|uniref:Cathepsin propeptide inhibitor domain-containing protein n=1 Tax=Cavenderia fasciculata TaxID=261658 RepID=F4Q4A8_CACFS|nr:uncharacterized protein DFA_07951 [Cavenderia fasciculata]EGG16970.1 hypothetical protein DFA_07951 [Cavenderia fasciculata]|eukprot:XP_004355446.1 hypothetical protein DFA_07951 [Cavenderia fasciculata]
MYKLFIYLLLTVLLALTATTSQAQQPSDGQLYSAFENWMQLYEISIPADQLQQKFQIFKENIIKIAELNSNHSDDVVDIELVYPEESATQSRSLLAIEEAEPTISYPSMDQPTYSVNEFSQMTTEEFLSMNTGFDGTEFVAPAATLAVSTIAAIAAGSAFLAGTAVATTVIVKKHLNKKKTEPVVEEKEIEMEEQVPKERRKTLIDIFRFHPKNSHQSITARTPSSTSS